MVTRFGMDGDARQSRLCAEEREAPRGLRHLRADARHAEETDREIDVAVRKIVDEAFGRAVEILTERRSRAGCRGKAAARQGDDHRRRLPRAPPTGRHACKFTDRIDIDRLKSVRGYGT